MYSRVYWRCGWKEAKVKEGDDVNARRGRNYEGGSEARGERDNLHFNCAKPRPRPVREGSRLDVVLALQREASLLFGFASTPVYY